LTSPGEQADLDILLLFQVRDVEDISEESLSLFTMLEPKLGQLTAVLWHSFDVSK